MEFSTFDGGLETRTCIAAGNCVVIKPAEQTPVSISVFVNLIADLVPEEF